MLAVWSQVHEGLQNGDKKLNLPGNNSQEVQNMFTEIEPHYRAMKNGVEKILRLNPGTFARPTLYSTLAQEVVEASSSFLKEMDEIVFRYEREARVRVDRLKKYETYILTAVLLVLTLEALLIFRPMVNKVKYTYRNFQQMNEQLEQEIAERKQTEVTLQKTQEELEERVKERTKELLDDKEELEKAYDELAKKNDQLGKFHKITVGREQDMIRMKKEVNELLEETGKPKKY